MGMILARPLETERNSKRGMFLLAVRLALGAVFILSSLPKLRQPYAFLANVFEYELVGPRTGVVVATVLPWIELTLGVCLLGGVLTAGAFLTSAVLGAVFVFVQASALYRGLAISCGCFHSSDGGGMVSYLTLTRAVLVMLAAAVAYLVCAWESPGGLLVRSIGKKRTPVPSPG